MSAFDDIEEPPTDCSDDGPCDPFGWCAKHKPDLPPTKDLSHEYQKEFLNAPIVNPTGD